MRFHWLCLCLLLVAVGCEKSDSPAGTVTIYTSVDQPVAEPILKAFEAT